MESARYMSSAGDDAEPQGLPVGGSKFCFGVCMAPWQPHKATSLDFVLNPEQLDSEPTTSRNKQGKPALGWFGPFQKSKNQLLFAHPNQSQGPSLEALDLWEKLYLSMSRALRLMSKHAEQRPARCRIRGFGRGRGFGGFPFEQPQAPGDDWVLGSISARQVVILHAGSWTWSHVPNEWREETPFVSWGLFLTISWKLKGRKLQKVGFPMERNSEAQGWSQKFGHSHRLRMSCQRDFVSKWSFFPTCGHFHTENMMVVEKSWILG